MSKSLPYYRVSKSTISDCNEIIKVHKHFGSAVFWKVFFLCMDSPHSAYILKINDDFILDLGILLRIPKQKAKIKKVLDTMSEFTIADPLLYKMNLLFMPEVFKINKKYLMGIMDDYDSKAIVKSFIVNAWDSWVIQCEIKNIQQEVSYEAKGRETFYIDCFNNFEKYVYKSISCGHLY